MDREIIIETATAVQSDSGEETWDWDSAVDVTIWAEWLPAGTTEAWRAAQRLASYVDGVFRIYDRSPRPTPQNTRIVFEGKVFDIKPPIEVGRGDGLEIPVVARGE
jgi:hypothetical protein